MKFLLATLLLSTPIFAQVDSASKAKAAVLKVINLNDSRIELSACGTNEGTYSFFRPSSSTVLNCSGTIIGTKRSVVIFKSKKVFSYFEVSACGERLGFGDQAYGQYTQKCEVRSLNSKTLIPAGPKRVIVYNTSWEYSSGYTSLKFKYDSVNYDGILVDFTSLMQDKDL